MKRKEKKLKLRVFATFRRVTATVVAFGVALAQVPMFSAYEAHVVSVTATIAPRCEDVAIGGVKFHDQNGNGTRELGEDGIANWIIALKRGPYAPVFDYNGNGANDSNDFGVLEDVIVDGAACPEGKQCDFNADGSLAAGDLTALQDWLASRDLGNQVTDANGAYAFGGLTFGDYVVTEALQEGWTPTTAHRRAVTVASCQTTVDFGNRQQEPQVGGSISGYKWHDLNRDGVWQQPAEPPVPAWGMTLFGDAVGAAVTDGSGWYQFSGLPAGSFEVREEIRDGWLNTTPTTVPVLLAGGEQRANVNFGNVSLTCGNGAPDTGEACDDGNLVNGDGCESDCRPTTWCGDGQVQTPNSFSQAEACDDGPANGSAGSGCTTQCTTKAGQCAARPTAYYRNHDGCHKGSGSGIWADEVSALSDRFFDVFVGLTGEQYCQQVYRPNCGSQQTVEGRRCRARLGLLGLETNIVADRLRADALLAGSNGGWSAFPALDLTATTTVGAAVARLEAIIASPTSTVRELRQAAAVAPRINRFYAEENPNAGECVFPGAGNGVREDGEACDDGNFAPWDGCSPTQTPEVVLNEISATPAGPDNAPKPAGEFVELYNRINRPISLAGWVLYDRGNSHKLPIVPENTTAGTTTIAARGRLTVYRNGDPDFNLNDRRDQVRLFNREIVRWGALIDQFSWQSKKAEGEAYARVPDGFGDWVDPCPTPDAPNVSTPCAASTAPWSSAPDLDGDEREAAGGDGPRESDQIAEEEVIAADETAVTEEAVNEPAPIVVPDPLPRPSPVASPTPTPSPADEPVAEIITAAPEPSPPPAPSPTPTETPQAAATPLPDVTTDAAPAASPEPVNVAAAASEEEPPAVPAEQPPITAVTPMLGATFGCRQRKRRDRSWLSC